MTHGRERLLTWAPRASVIAFMLVISLFALDAFSGNMPRNGDFPPSPSSDPLEPSRLIRDIS